MRFKPLFSASLALALVAAAAWYLLGGAGDGAGASAPGQARGASDGEGASGAPGSAPGGGQRPIDVAFVEVAPVPIDRTDQLPGRVVSFQVAEIRPQVSGIIESRLFEEGSYVEEGQQLYQIDPARYEADYARAEASLEDAQARRRNARMLLARYEGLVEHNAVSQQEYDDAQASLDQAEAAVSLAEAELKTARINLEYTEVYAPISGYIGPSTVTRGALVTARQEMPLATVRQIDPVYVDLSQPAADARKLQERLMNSKLQEDKTSYAVTLRLQSTGETYPHEGFLDATDVAVDVQTGAIRLRSVFPNPDDRLLPGMFVRASIEAVGETREIVVPQKAVTIEPGGGKSVWLAGADDTAIRQPIRTGAAYDNQWVVVSGLQRGDRLITDGTMNLREGAPLKLSQAAAPDHGRAR